MRIDPYCGIYHSSPSVIYNGSDLDIEVAVTRAYNGGTDFKLEYCVNRRTYSAKMIPSVYSDDVVIYSATMHSSDLKNATVVDYSITEGLFTLFDHEIQIKNIPSFPPVIITELYSRPKRTITTTKFIELTNISDKTVDLYDYSIYSDRKGLSVLIASERGTYCISPRETVILRFLVPQSFDENGNVVQSHEEYLRSICDENIYHKSSYTPARVLDIDLTVTDSATGERIIDKSLFAIASHYAAETISLRGRNGEINENYFEISINQNPASIDVFAMRSVLFAPNPDMPSKGKILLKNADATPGVLDPVIGLPNAKNKKMPVIIITSPVSSHLMSDGELEIRYTVANGGDVSFAEIYSQGTTSRLYATKLSDNEYSLTLPSKLVLSTKSVEMALTVGSGIHSATLGSKERPLRFAITDNVGPSVSMISPKPDFCYSGEYTPTISATLYDPSAVNIPSCAIILDDIDVTDDVEWHGCSFTYTVKKPLSDGSHKLRLKLVDMLGNCSKLSIPFSVAPEDVMNCYFGEVHNHTAESDGSGTPEDSILYVRDTVGMDFYSVTDHSHYMTDEKYEKQIDIANKYNEPGKFACLYGWEMTWNNGSSWWGHLNVIGSNSIIIDKDSYSLGMLYDWLAENGGIGMYNHPGYPWGNFNEYSCDPEIANRSMCLAEIKTPAYDFEYLNMLRKGYKVSPVANEDAHNDHWGNNNNSTGYILAPYLSRENVMDAFRKRRTYSTTDKTLKMKYSINGKWLGSTLDAPEKLDVCIDLSTEHEFGLGKVQLVTVNNMVVREINLGIKQSYVWNFTVDPLYPFYYVRIIGDGKYTVSSPIWITGCEGLSVSSLRLDSSANINKPITLSFSLKNLTSKPLKCIKADIYITPNTGFNADDEPYITVYLDKLKASANTEISRTLPSVPKHKTLTVVVSAENNNGKKYAATRSVVGTQLFIAEILPLSSDCTVTSSNAREVTVSNPFAYIKIYNNSCCDVDLSSAMLRFWAKTGKDPLDANIVDLSGYTVKSRSSLVVWQRAPESELTVSDFNKRYGTALTEGENIIATDKKIVSSEETAALFDIVYKGDVVSRASYNYCNESRKNEIVCDRSFHFAYVPDLTSTTKRIYEEDKPMPDSIMNTQTTDFVSGEPTAAEEKAEKNAAKAKEKKDRSLAGMTVPAVSGIAAVALTLGALAGSLKKEKKKAVVTVSPAEDPKTVKAKKKARKKSEKRIIKKVSKNVSKDMEKAIDKKITSASSLNIDIQMKKDKDTIKQAKKNIKTLKMRKKAEKEAAKREKELKKLRGY